MGTAEIRDLLGVSNQRLWQLARWPTFPLPVATLGSGRVWHRRRLEAGVRGVVELADGRVKKSRGRFRQVRDLDLEMARRGFKWPGAR